jgi:hypothetical protein
VIDLLLLSVSLLSIDLSLSLLLLSIDLSAVIDLSVAD